MVTDKKLTSSLEFLGSRRPGLLYFLPVGFDGDGHGDPRSREADPRSAEQAGSCVESDCKSPAAVCLSHI